MKEKVVIVLLVFVLAAALMTGCSDNTGQEEKNFRVAFITRSQTDTFAVWLADEMIAEAKKYPDITLEVLDGEGSDEKQSAVIEQAIAGGYDAIVVQPSNGEAQRPYVEKIVASGIIAVTTNSRIEGIEGASAVDTDPYMQAQVNAEAAISLVPENGKVVIIKGPAGNLHADERYKAWKEVFFTARPDVTILGEDFGNWDREKAKKLMTDWAGMQESIDAIIAMDDDMAIGALEAVIGNPAYDNVLSFGVDGTPEACLLIRQGKMTATALQSAIELAELNMQTVHDLLTGRKTKVDGDIRTTIVNKVNVGKYLEIYAERGLITQEELNAAEAAGEAAEKEEMTESDDGTG